MSGTRDQQRDDVLRAFHAACRRPTAADIAEWVERHPGFAGDIRAYAEAALRMAQTEGRAPAPSAALVHKTRVMTDLLLRQALGPPRAPPAKPRRKPLPPRDDR